MSKKRKKGIERSYFKRFHIDDFSETTNIILRNVPKELHEEFQQWCKDNGYTVVGKIRRMMYDCIIGKIK